jgi:hypothetical protein
MNLISNVTIKSINRSVTIKEIHNGTRNWNGNSYVPIG